MLKYFTYFTITNRRKKWLILSTEQNALIANMNGLHVAEVEHQIIALNVVVN
jgi:hypothetical protein